MRRNQRFSTSTPESPTLSSRFLTVLEQVRRDSLLKTDLGSLSYIRDVMFASTCACTTTILVPRIVHEDAVDQPTSENGNCCNVEVELELNGSRVC